MALMIYLCALASFFVACSAIISQPGCCDDPRICRPRVITSCPRKSPIEACPTCCCDSSENVEFYDPDRPEPWCSAPPAVYTVKFVGTWTLVCNPDYYVSNAHWSPPTGVSHTTDYQMWDACMENVSPGVARVSQFGATGVIEREWEGNSTHILDTFKGGVIGGGGNVSSDLSVDKYHQWVSTISMLAPSRDRMVGVANLRLCDGIDWKRTVKVCSELFSTATRSDRVHPRMQRNSVQWNNCSFGYFEFTFKEYKNASQQIPTSEKIFEAGKVCPEDRNCDCRTCCCQSTPGVDFYRPNASNTFTECPARDNAEYKVSLIPTTSDICHPTTPFPGNSEFSELLLTSHTIYQIFSREITEIDSFYPYILYPEHALPLVEAALDDEVELGTIHDYFTPDMIEPDGEKKRRVGEIKVTPFYSYVSLISTIGMNNWVGFSGLNLCGPRGWKPHFEVCLPLMAAVNKTKNPNGSTEAQGNNCAFAMARFDRIDRPAPTCTPHDESVFSDPNLQLSACCYCEFILEGRVLRVTERFGDRRYLYNLLVKVTTVHYDEIGHIEAEDIVTIKVCSLPFRIKFRRLYRLTGARELGTNELEISENGIVGNIPELITGPLGAGPCPTYILGGNCDDPR